MPLDPEDPEAWLRLARSDLAYAEKPPEGALYEPSVFLAQQAAEKALKALLVARGVPFPKTHSLTLLLELTTQAEGQLPPEILQVAVLEAHTLRGRYPLGLPEITQREWEEALGLARGVVRWVEGLLHG